MDEVMRGEFGARVYSHDIDQYTDLLKGDHDEYAEEAIIKWLIKEGGWEIYETTLGIPWGFNGLVVSEGSPSNVWMDSLDYGDYSSFKDILEDVYEIDVEGLAEREGIDLDDEDAMYEFVETLWDKYADSPKYYHQITYTEGQLKDPDYIAPRKWN